jgi:hypothetical protein
MEAKSSHTSITSADRLPLRRGTDASFSFWQMNQRKSRGGCSQRTQLRVATDGDSDTVLATYHLAIGNALEYFG